MRKSRQQQRDFLHGVLPSNFLTCRLWYCIQLEKTFGHSSFGFGIGWVQESASTQLDFESFWVVVIAFTPPTHHNIRMCFYHSVMAHEIVCLVFLMSEEGSYSESLILQLAQQMLRGILLQRTASQRKTLNYRFIGFLLCVNP
jgi:hypothetical protein